MTTGAPLVGEDGEHDLVAPLAVEDLVLHEVCLLAHAQAAHQGGRPRIVGVGAADDTVQADLVEREVEDARCRLGRVAATVIVGVEDEAELWQYR